ncbi:hypothetical protein BsWGS_29142 [Bradybaena similaris]
MNYVGSFTILDRGDAPAQAVIDRNARSLAQRVVDETKEELDKVMTRVHTIYGSMEMPEDAPTNPTMEYLSDLAELEALLKDEIKKRQYQQQVTVFIVGYQDVCLQKLRLIQQVNEFFLDNTKSIEEEDWFPKSPDLDLDVDEMSNAMEDSLNHAHELTNRLAELNKEMTDYLLALAEKKANGRGRKKIEKSLQQAKDEVNSLREKLLTLQNELQEREDKVQSLFKQLDFKHLDIQKFRTAAELGKQKIILVQKELDDQKKANEETKGAFTKLLKQNQDLQEKHRQEVDDVKQQYESRLKQLQEASVEAMSEVEIPDPESELNQHMPVQPAKQETSPLARTAKVAGKTSLSTAKQQTSRYPARNKAEMTASSKINRQTNVARSDKDAADAGSQDEASEPAAGAASDLKSPFHASRSRQQGKATAQPVMEPDYDSDIDLFDEDTWAAVPDDQLKGRFAQYRQLSSDKIKELEEQLQLTVAKTQRKAASLKAQFREHKSKWDMEKKTLLEQVDQSLRFQTDAEREADVGLTQLENFITDQETLEQQGDNIQGGELLKVLVVQTSADAEATAKGSAEQAAVSETPSQSDGATSGPESEQDMKRLMQQTDDAKVQEINARMGTSTSDPAAVNTEPSTLQDTEATLEEVKDAAESQGSMSPGVHLPRQPTLGGDEMVLHDGDDDDDIHHHDDEGEENLEEEVCVPDDISELKEPSMYDVGTSPMSGTHRNSREVTSTPRAPSQLSKSSTSLFEQPLLREYLRAYEGVVNFKEAVARMFLEKDLMAAYQMTSDLETLTYDQSKKSMPQIEELTGNILFVLDRLGSIISSHLLYDREPRVSSLNVYSREPAVKSPSESLPEQSLTPHHTKDAADSVTPSHQNGVHSRKSSNASDKLLIQELQDQYNLLKEQLVQDGKNRKEQIQQNSAVMQEMQNTIIKLQKELSSAGNINVQPKSAVPENIEDAVQEQSPSPETSVLFTRLDSERNAKIMKKAVMEDKLDPEKYKEAVSKMDEYVSLPARRLGNLVKKYVHLRQLRDTEEKVKKSARMTEEVLHALDKMENLQNQRTRQWTERMNGMGTERLKLANLLMDTLDTIEQESGIFLIKPMYSYRGREAKLDQVSKLSRPVRHRHRRMAPYSETGSSFVPASTPNSNYRFIRNEEDLSQKLPQMQAKSTHVYPTDPATDHSHDEVKVSGSHVTLSSGSPGSTWSMQTSQPWKDQQPNSFHTPRILELDINRMLIGQNNISSKLPCQPTDDRLVNINQNTLRSYVTIQRPTACMAADRPFSGPGRTTSQKVVVSQVDKDIPVSIPSPQPLPPISTGKEDVQERETAQSPSSVASSYKDSNDVPRKSAGVFHVPV